MTQTLPEWVVEDRDLTKGRTKPTTLKRVLHRLPTIIIRISKMSSKDQFHLICNINNLICNSCRITNQRRRSSTACIGSNWHLSSAVRLVDQWRLNPCCLITLVVHNASYRLSSKEDTMVSNRLKTIPMVNQTRTVTTVTTDSLRSWLNTTRPTPRYPVELLDRLNHRSNPHLLGAIRIRCTCFPKLRDIPTMLSLPLQH